MSDVRVREVPWSTTLPTSATDEDHFVCCVNGNVTLCKLNAAGMEYVPDMEDPTCVVCDDLKGGPYCPILDYCRGCKS